MRHPALTNARTLMYRVVTCVVRRSTRRNSSKALVSTVSQQVTSIDASRDAAVFV